MLLPGSLALLNQVPLSSWSGCPVNGPLLPRPVQLDRSQILHEATENLIKSLDSAIKNNIKAGSDVDNTSFSIAFVSPCQENTNDEGILTDWASSRCCLDG